MQDMKIIVSKTQTEKSIVDFLESKGFILQMKLFQTSWVLISKGKYSLFDFEPSNAYTTYHKVTLEELREILN